MFNIFKQITEKKRCKYVPMDPNNAVEFPYMNDLHISVVGGYLSNLSMTCDLPELPSAELLTIVDEPYMEPAIVASFEQELKEIFVVPRLNMLHQTQNRVNNSQLVESFLSFLLQLLYHKADLTLYPFEDRIENLENELRFLLTILGDMSWMMCHSHEHNAGLQNLLPGFEAMANQAGSFVHYLYFSADQSVEEIDEGLAAVLSKIDLLKAKIQSSIEASAHATTPRTSAVDSILILDSVVDDLDDLLQRDDDQIADVKNEVNLLHHELLLTHSSIRDMRTPQPSEIGELKEPLMRIGDMAHQAQYLITAFLVKDAPLWYVIHRLTDLNHKIEPLRKGIQLITLKYNFGGLKVAEYFRAELPLHHKRNIEVTVGFEDKTTDILDQLVGGATQSLHVISILGMPGLGKTTLANKLYNHPLVSYTFDKLSWSIVSQAYKRQSVLGNILIQLSELKKDKILEMEEEILVEHIYKTLKGRRYLIVMDDIWESSVWDAFQRSFPDDGNGSRVLLTSRNKDVAPPNSILIELPFLTDEQCWELLQKKVFGSRTCPSQLQGIGRKLAAKCCGLPLTVVVIAGVLSTLDEEESTWEEVGGSLASYIDSEDNSVMQILELSYKHLPDHLKPCFLYFGKFKEDEEILVGKLKRLWVAEGFVRNDNDKSTENVAEEYLIELIDKSLVMIAKTRKDGRGAKSCVVHDLLRDMCLKKSKEENFLKYTNNNYYTIYEEGHREPASGEAEPLSYCQHARSFSGDQKTSSFHVWDMRLLRVLHFKCIYSNGKWLTFRIEYLVNLRYLVIDNLPTLIGRLVNLEYLRVHGWERVHLPPAIMKMKKLRYLCASHAEAEYGEDWNITNQTNNLEYLSKVSIKEVKDEELLKCSPLLRKLKCRYDQTMGAYPHFDLRFLTQLRSLSLDGVLSKGDFGFPSSIRKLTLSESGLSWEKMSIVGRLEFLEVLKLENKAFEGERWDTRDGEFQKLRFLQLDGLDNLLEWNVASYMHFPELQQLILIDCENLEEIPGEIGEIPTLEMIKVERGCLHTLVESAERIKEEQRDIGNEDLMVSIDPAYKWRIPSIDFNSPIAIYASEIKPLDFWESEGDA